uniref:DUF4283 domain-containing protein n=1 Tax=Setaria viridis TaxID=4556 RepID=A0A4U6SV11_SETVI|nr:LOW QUALITY PROTEIN: hypothetical protein SEVIR_9G168700v2 [Setaria viridis]
MAIGDPNTRPDEETIIVPNSFDLERDAREWEGTALVPWAIHMPRGAGARDIEDLLREQLRLQQGDVIVAVHQPEPFLIRFTTAEQCAATRSHGRFRGHGIDICLRPWRSLSHALGLRIFYRVRLYLDGIPIHACTPDIVERIISTHCALQYINMTLSSRPTPGTSIFGLDGKSNAIPKRVWLLFTHRSADKSSAVTITTSLPDRWQQGVRYEVFLHLGVLEDYTAAARDLDGAINNPSAFTPTLRGYAWRYGLPDGAPSDARSKFPARLPHPPRDTEPRADDDRDRRRGTWDHGRDDQGKSSGRNDVSRRDSRNDISHNGHDSRRGDNSSCRDSFHWPRRPEDDDNDDTDYDHPGRGRDRSNKPHDSRGRDVVRRDRTRSPRWWDAEFRGGQRRVAEAPPLAAPSPTKVPNKSSFAAFAPALPRFDDLRAMVRAQVEALFNAQAMAIHHTFQAMASSQVRSTDLLSPASPVQPMSSKDLVACGVDEFFSRSCSLVDSLDTPPRPAGNQAWSDPPLHLVPLQRVFDRLGSALQGRPSTREVELALNQMQLLGDTTPTAIDRPRAAVTASPTAATLAPSGKLDRVLASPVRTASWADSLASRADPLGPASDSGARGARIGPPVRMASWTDSLASRADPLGPAQDWSPSGVRAGPMLSPGPAVGAMGAQAANHATVEDTHDAAEGGSVDDLFAAPAPPILQQPPLRRQRTRRSFDMSAVRRSARLALKPSVPALQRAQRNLWRKLGVSDDELRPVEDILQEYINSHQWPLPDHVIAAMTALFDLDDEGAEQVNEALIHHAGQTVQDIQNELAIRQA